ncbi:histone-lysine N-methyltransferase PRDM9-like isoform X2 [Acanthaster planci]|uniref:Histone-lysine N-methyltransferase PRDM9-like isoform X2 n=1 Tax=Acanthaster planci TaxID=133434 RepID=A0A8B7ZD78_ACAPL|nr:histone-lysine N-methyltransferase PRDM9-like isoform X2 [Acanthaster planci]
MPRAFLVKKRGTFQDRPEPDYDAEYLENNRSQSASQNDLGETWQHEPNWGKNDALTKNYSTCQDETAAAASHKTSLYVHSSSTSSQSDTKELVEPMDLSQAKPTLVVSSTSAFEYVEPTMRAAQDTKARPSKCQPTFKASRCLDLSDEPLDLHVRRTTEGISLQSSATIPAFTSAPSLPSRLYSTSAYQRCQDEPTPASALYSYMIRGTATGLHSYFKDVTSYHHYSEWQQETGRSRPNPSGPQFYEEENVTTPPTTKESPTKQDFYTLPPRYYIDKYILPEDIKKHSNIQQIKTEPQTPLKISPCEGQLVKIPPHPPKPERFLIKHENVSSRSEYKGRVMKRSARQPILGLEYIQNTPNFQDSESPDRDSSPSITPQLLELESIEQQNLELGCSSKHQNSQYSPESTSDTTGKASTIKVDKPAQYKKYICDICGKGFSRSNTLVTHKRIHTGDKPFKCELCGRAFRQPGNLTRHRLTHTTVKPYVCQQCGKAFNRASNLHTHMRTHTNYKPFTCQYCGKGFHQKIDMKIHSYTHTGEKPHKCKKCGRGFKQLTHLTYHMRTHSDIKMYTCAYCGKGFNQKGNLQAHIYGHTGFTLASTLNTHRRTHADKKPYACQYCGKDFYQKNALKSHMISSHPYTGESLL